MILNLNQLRSFYTAAKIGSITKAAELMMVTPPAITMQIKQLEKTVGLSLLYREGNGVRLTDVGERIFKDVDMVFKKIQEMENFFEDISTSKIGKLKIGFPQALAKHMAPRLVLAFNDIYPNIKIQLDQGTNKEMVKSILTHKNELALIRTMPDEKRIRIKVIGKANVALVCAPKSKFLTGTKISLAEISNFPLIIQQKGSAVREVVFDYLRKFRVKPPITMESGNPELTRELVRQDKGISFLEEYSIEKKGKNALKQIRILEGSPTIEFGIGYLNRKQLSPAAWAFLRMVDKSKDLFPFIKSP